LNRSLTLLVAAAALGAAPLPAFAQNWPATATAAAPAMTEPTTVAFVQAKPAPRPDTLVRTPLRLTEQRVAEVLRSGPSVEDGEVSPVSMRPKDEWFDDEGFRFADKRLAYKRRF
jgi:hypothetical protein